MSDPVRYDEVWGEWSGEPAGLAPTKGGEFVKWEDYARLKAEVESVRQVAQDNKTETEATRIENARLKAEVERLRKAGDEMAVCLEAYNRCKPYDGPMTIKCLDAWNAAKEGKPSV